MKRSAIKLFNDYQIIRYPIGQDTVIEYHQEYDHWQAVSKIFAHPHDGHMVKSLPIKTVLELLRGNKHGN